MPTGSRDHGVGAVLQDRRRNAVLAWVITAIVAVTAVQSLSAGVYLWGVFALVVAGLAVVPPVTYRDASVMLPVEVLALGALPVLARVVTVQVSSPPLVGDVFTYLSVAALALVVAVELDVFTPVRMTTWFAVFFVVVATMAAAGVWAVTAWVSDLYLGTTFVLDPALTPEEQEAAVMWDFVAATLAGVVAGVVFEWYFCRRVHGRERLPERVREVVEGR
ncbi:MAG: hypothetical protein ABEJ42_04165 [Halobacteriaceae archaeon]